MGLFGDDKGFDDARDNIWKNKGLLGQIGLPDYQEYNPELLHNESAKYQLVDDDAQSKSQQVSALQRLAGLSENGLSAEDDAAFNRARTQSNQLARSGTESALHNAAARGIGGSGLEFAMREGANQDAATRNQQANLDQAAAAAKQRALYTTAYGDQLAKVRDQNVKTNAANSDIINNFNMANTQARNATQGANAGITNNAFMYNQGLKDKNFQNQMQQYGVASGLNNQNSQISLAESEQERKRRGALVGTAGAVIGGMYGGPAGASAGYAIGSGVGG